MAINVEGMTVGELIEELSQYNSDLKVYVPTGGKLEYSTIKLSEYYYTKEDLKPTVKDKLHEDVNKKTNVAVRLWY